MMHIKWVFTAEDRLTINLAIDYRSCVYLWMRHIPVCTFALSFFGLVSAMCGSAVGLHPVLGYLLCAQILSIHSSIPALISPHPIRSLSLPSITIPIVLELT